MPDHPSAREAPPPPRTPTRWILMALALLVALALIVIASTLWILHRG